MDKLNFNAQKIYDTEFSLDFKGYAPQEVDSVLDRVILDYQFYESYIVKLNEQLDNMNLTLASKEAQIIELEAKLKAIEKSTVDQNVNNVDLMKRIARLEAIVYNKDE